LKYVFAAFVIFAKGDRVMAFLKTAVGW